MRTSAPSIAPSLQRSQPRPSQCRAAVPEVRQDGVGAGKAELGDELAGRRLDQGPDRQRHEAGGDGEDQAEPEQDSAAEKPHASSPRA